MRTLKFKLKMTTLILISLPLLTFVVMELTDRQIR